jgi:hypothetical protein
MAIFMAGKAQIGVVYRFLRRLKFAREQFFLTATAQNIKRPVRLRSAPRLVRVARCQRQKFTQLQLLTYTSNMQTSLIGLEACTGAHAVAQRPGATPAPRTTHSVATGANGTRRNMDRPLEKMVKLSS